MSSSNEKDDEKEKIEPGKGVNRGCGRYLGSCGHRADGDQSPITLSGTCRCGRVWSWTCPGNGCKGQSLHC